MNFQCVIHLQSIQFQLVQSFFAFKFKYNSVHRSINIHLVRAKLANGNASPYSSLRESPNLAARQFEKHKKFLKSPSLLFNEKNKQFKDESTQFMKKVIQY